MLEEKLKATLKDASRKLTGPKKRAFMAKVTQDYLDGWARKAGIYLDHTDLSKMTAEGRNQSRASPE